jgi:hypothetical protein
MECGFSLVFRWSNYAPSPPLSRKGECGKQSGGAEIPQSVSVMVFPKKAGIDLAERLAGVFPAPQFDHANCHALREFAPDKALRRALLNNAMRPRIRNIPPTLAPFSQSLDNVERRRDTTQGALPLPVCYGCFAHMVFRWSICAPYSPRH